MSHGPEVGAAVTGSHWPTLWARRGERVTNRRQARTDTVSPSRLGHLWAPDPAARLRPGWARGQSAGKSRLLFSVALARDGLSGSPAGPGRA